MKFQIARDFATSIAKLPDVYSFRDRKWRSSILYFCIITLIFVFPLTISILTMENFLFSSFGIDIVNEEDYAVVLKDEDLLKARKDDMFEVVEYLPDGCYFSGGRLIFDDTYVVTYTRTQRVDDNIETEKVNLVYNPTDDTQFETKDSITIVYHEYYYDLYLKGFKFTCAYQSSFNLNYSDMVRRNITDAEAIEDILNVAFIGFINNISWVIIIVLFLILGLLNFLFIILIALCSRFLKYRDSNFPEFGEIVKVLIYCSTIPCLVGFVLGFFGAFTIATVLYNFILPFIAFYVYIKNKSIIKGTLSTKKAKEAEYVL